MSNLYGPLRVGYIKLQAGKNASFEIGALLTLMGAEYTFTFETINIECGLLWNQENAINRRIQVKQTIGRLEETTQPLLLRAGVSKSTWRTESCGRPTRRSMSPRRSSTPWRFSCATRTLPSRTRNCERFCGPEYRRTGVSADLCQTPPEKNRPRSRPARVCPYRTLWLGIASGTTWIPTPPLLSEPDL